mgnify:CR=1 FL=1
MFMKLLYSLLLTLFLSCTLFSEEETCALMIGDEIDPEEYSELLGKKIYFCCGSCVKAFDSNQAYYIKALPALAKKFSATEQKKLGVDKIKLLDQRFCPIYPERVVNPNSKSVEYKGKKIYFWSSSALRRWDRDPEKYFKEAFEKGHLPQFK